MSQSTHRVVGIMGAMPEEINGIIELLTDKQSVEIGGRTYYIGCINNIQTVVVFSRWGKVAAATTVTTLLLEFNINELIFTGVAGAIDADLQIGDVVIGQRLFQHDMDARPLMPRFEIPLLGISFIECAAESIQTAKAIIDDLLTEKHLHKVIEQKELDHFGIHHPKVVIGDIASGDQFFASNEAKQNLQQSLPTVLCVEMEGAAVAQVCYEYKIPFTIIRTISDTANEAAAIDFPAFIQHISSKYSREIIKGYFN